MKIYSPSGYPRCKWVVCLSEQVWRNVALHHLLTSGSSAVNGRMGVNSICYSSSSESNGFKFKKHLNAIIFYMKHRFRFTRSEFDWFHVDYMWIIAMFFYQLFGLFVLLTAPIHCRWKWKWRDIRPSMVTHTRNLCSANNPSKVHTAVNKNTLWTHTAIYAATPVEQLGVRCLAQGHLSRAIEGGKSAVHSLPPPTIPAGLKLELATFGLRVRLSNIRPRLPPWFTGEQVMQNFSKSFWITKQIHLCLGWPEGEYIFIFSFLLFYN